VLVQALLTLLPLPAAAALGWHAIGLRRPHHLRLTVFPAATVVFGYVAPFPPQALTTIALAVLLVALVAVGEEIAFRGVLLHLLAPRGVAAAVALSSLLFGLTHTVNLLLGAPPAGVALQVFFAGTGAVGLAALRICTGSLWPGIALHAAYDLASASRRSIRRPGTAGSTTRSTASAGSSSPSSSCGRAGEQCPVRGSRASTTCGRRLRNASHHGVRPYGS
jgi:membrane protease YdiL (CAAX protease family)